MRYKSLQLLVDVAQRWSRRFRRFNRIYVFSCIMAAPLNCLLVVGLNLIELRQLIAIAFGRFKLFDEFMQRA